MRHGKRISQASVIRSWLLSSGQQTHCGFPKSFSVDTEGQCCGCLSQVGATSEDELSLKTISKSSLSEVNMECQLTPPGQRLLRNVWEEYGLEKQRGSRQGAARLCFSAGLLGGRGWSLVVYHTS